MCQIMYQKQNMCYSNGNYPFRLIINFVMNIAKVFFVPMGWSEYKSVW